MKNELVLAIGALAAEKNLPKEVVFEAVEDALASAYRREDAGVTGNIVVKIDGETGDMNAWREREVATEDIEEWDDEIHISLEEARRFKKDATIGEMLKFELKIPENAGRIAAQTAKQVVLQRLREAERESVYDEYADREGEILLGTVQRLEGRQTIIELGKGTEAVMPGSLSVRNEHLRPGQKVRVLILEVQKAARGPQLVVTRSHPDFLRKLFETEVPEMADGRVDIVSIAREPGYRSKIAVFTRHPNVDPIGAAVGMRASRIQNVVNELNGERIDVVLWDPDPAKFVANAISPSEVASVEVNEEERQATVYVPNRMLSLAIGREGQNARLAAKLTGWWITVHSEAALERTDAAVVEAPSLFEPAPPGEEPIVIQPPALEPEPARKPEPVAATAAAAATEEAPAAEAEGEATAAETEGETEIPLMEPEPVYDEREETKKDDYEKFDEEDYAEYELEDFVDEDGSTVAGIRFAEDVLPDRPDDDDKSKDPKRKKRAPRFVEALEEDLEEIDYSGRIH